MSRREKLLAKLVCLAISGMILLIGVSATSYINQNAAKKGILVCSQRIMKLPEAIKPLALPHCETFIYPQKLKLDSPLIKDIVIDDKQPNVESTAKIIFGGVNKPFVHIRLCEKFQKGFSYEIKIFSYDKYDSSYN